MKQTVRVDDNSVEALERAIGQLRMLGMPEGANLRVLTRASFNPDGGYSRKVTARWQAV